MAEADEVAAQLRSELTAIGADLGETVPEMETRAEFVDCWEKFSSLQRLRNGGRAWWSALAAHFTTAVAHHPRAGRRSELAAQLGAAGSQLQAAAELTDTPIPPGPTDPKEWTEWAWSCEGPEQIELLGSLHPIVPALGDLIEKAALGSEIFWREEAVEESATTASVETVLEPVEQPVATPEEIVSEPAPQALPEVKIAPQTPPEKPVVTAPVLEERPAVEEKPAAPSFDPPPALASIDENLHLPLWQSRRFGLAALIADAAEPGDSTVPPWVLRVAALGPAIRLEDGSLAAPLAAELAGFSRESLRNHHRIAERATRLLLAAALLRPALHAPATGAASVLSQLDLDAELGLREVAAVAASVSRFGFHGVGLSSAGLGVAGELSNLVKLRSDLRSDYDAWLQEAGDARLKYVPALNIWHNWIGRGSDAGAALKGMLDAVFAGATDEAAGLNQWNSHEAVTARIREGMLVYGNGNALEGNVLRRLQGMVERAVQLARRRLALDEKSVRGAEGFLRDAVNQLITQVRAHLPGALAEAVSLGRENQDLGVRTAATLLEAELRLLDPLLAGKESAAVGEPSADDLCAAELLRLREVEFDEEMHPRVTEEGTVKLLAGLAASGAPDWAAAWRLQCEAGNHSATAWLLEFFERKPQPGCDPEQLGHERDGLVATAQHRLKQSLNHALDALNVGARFGYCSQAEVQSWSAELEFLKELAGEDLNFWRHDAAIAEIRQRLDSRRAVAVEEARGRLARIENVKIEQRARVEKVLADGDVQTANDYLERLTSGRTLPEPTIADASLDRFFGPEGWIHRGPEGLRGKGGTQLQQLIREGSSLESLDFSQLPEGEVRAAALALVAAWFELHQSRRLSVEALKQVFAGLGFQPRGARSSGPSQGASTVERSTVQTEPLSDREICAVATFGSQAAGEYRVTGIWGRPDVDDLLGLVRSANVPVGAAHLVLYFGVLDANARRRLARDCRSKRGAFAVIDDALLVFLAAQPRGRLAALFADALPFALVEPYKHTGEVPPEMFYGRRREFDSLLDPTGSCLVYGGRQLGKTALLHAVRGAFHRPAEQHYSYYLDLAKDIFRLGRPVDSLWTRLIEVWKTDRILPEKTPANTGAPRVLELVRHWLDADPQRRILLLLDEADKFFEADAQPADRDADPYPRSTLLRGAMRETGGRLKVVFAGLHNVQRFSRQSNSPLAHLNQPICIGPMLSAGEAEEAQRLIEWPLAAAGYRFASSDLPARILALTNYYPSLLQLVGSSLLAHLQERHTTLFDWRQTPPCMIEERHLDEVFARQDLHARMRDHFRLTLDLDRRYRAIAYWLAYRHKIDGREEGYESAELRADLLREWPLGFTSHDDPDHFRALLEEMVGLGILRQVGLTGRFALRNPNVVTLLGSEAEIDGEIDQMKTLERELTYDARTFRRRLNGTEAEGVSPLTTEQEGMLHRGESLVAIIHGSAASALDQVPRALLSLLSPWSTETAEQIVSPPAFRTWLDRVERRDQEGYQLLLVPAALPWDRVWVEAALERLRRHSSRKAFTIVVFFADPDRTAALVEAAALPESDAALRTLTLVPWHDDAIRQWFEEHNAVPTTPSRRELLRDATGGWHRWIEPLCQTPERGFDAALATARQRLSQPAELARCGEDLFGAASAESASRRRMLSAAADLDGATSAEIAELLGVDLTTVDSALRWAALLGVANEAGGRWKIEPFAARCLAASATT
ncbi:MAG: hypothetical protein ABJF10_06280 [Chthoniobacter sp.]|uniref:hypothetical protein n=1 Tax=Chthoniobacter sp. TaxID=2510640 RepID=UPI0032A4DD1C